MADGFFTGEVFDFAGGQISVNEIALAIFCRTAKWLFLLNK